MALKCILERNCVEILVKPATKELLVSLCALHNQILAGRAGKLIDVDQALAATYEERDAELDA